MISSVCFEAGENCSLLDYNTARSGNLLATFRDDLWGSRLQES